MREGHKAVVSPLGRKATVLVVDDETPIRSALAGALKDVGYRVLRSATGIQAVRKAADPGVEVVLLDVRMPGRLDGLEAARQIQEQWPAKEILFVSAFVDDEAFRRKVKESGLRAGIVEKPSSDSQFNDLVAAIRHLRDGSSSSVGGDTSTVRIDAIDLALYRALEKHPELLKTLDWRLFEKLLADILDTFGYSVELTRATKDGGVDIFAFRRSSQLGGEMYILQAKRWLNRVGVEPVQRLLFLHNANRATKSCLATTSTFTRGAWQLANQYQWQLALRDYDAIREWVTEALSRKLKRSPNPTPATDG